MIKITLNHYLFFCYPSLLLWFHGWPYVAIQCNVDIVKSLVSRHLFTIRTFFTIQHVFHLINWILVTANCLLYPHFLLFIFHYIHVTLYQQGWKCYSAWRWRVRLTILTRNGDLKLKTLRLTTTDNHWWPLTSTATDLLYLYCTV